MTGNSPKDIISLMYHDVIEKSVEESGFQNTGAIIYKIMRNDFEIQIKTLFNTCLKKCINRNDIFLTFDDGGESSYSIIAPILEKYGFRGYFFLISSLIGQKGFVKKAQIIDLYKRGHIIGTHSHSHPENISLLSAKEVKMEWDISIGILESIINDAIFAASIPGGFYSEESRKILGDSGIKYIFTSKPIIRVRIFPNNQYVVGRYAIINGLNEGHFAGLINRKPLILAFHWIRWEIMAIAKVILGKHYHNLRKYILNKFQRQYFF